MLKVGSKGTDVVRLQKALKAAVSMLVQPMANLAQKQSRR